MGWRGQLSICRLAGLATFVVLALLACAPSGSSAAGRNSTKIVVSLKFPAFHGTLGSPRRGCLGSRELKMYRVRNGHRKLLGRDTSEDDGGWSVPVGSNLTSGEYYATVAKRGKCRAARSKTLTID